MIIFNFWDRETRFFDDLQRGASQAHDAAAVLLRLLDSLGQGGGLAILEELARKRREHKRLANQTSERIAKAFVTPIQRDDLERLSGDLYRISKTIEKIGERLTIAPAGAVLATVRAEFLNIEGACAIVVDLVGRLCKGVNVRKIADTHERLQNIETDADRVLLDHLRELYISEQDARLLIYWKDLYSLLEKAVDRCRDAGNVVFQIVLKAS